MAERVPKSPLISIAVDRSDGASLQVQIFDQIRHAILEGRMAPGVRLPSSRVLAGELSVSRNTVMAAYDRLYAEGYTEGRVGSGTCVSSVLPEELLAARPASGPARLAPARAAKVSALPGRLRPHSKTPVGRAFRPGFPDLEAFPFQLWSRMLAKFWRHPPRDLLFGGDLAGHRPLREAIAAYLGAVRGVTCTADQVMITSGAQQALDLVARTVIDPGDSVWLEEPGYAGLRSAFLAAGARLAPVPVDGEGLSVSRGRDMAADAVLAAVTPSHQYPLGVTMSLSRRLELLDWARDAGAWVLEDDYDSEFRYAGKPLSALQGLDLDGRVIYTGTFSKILFPALRLGYAVLPEPLIAPFLTVRAGLDDQPSIVAQPALAAFISEGHFAGHVRRLRGIYAERQEALAVSLVRHAGGLLHAERHETGMHLVAEFGEGVTIGDTEASHRAAEAGIAAPAIGGFYFGEPTRSGLVLGYAGLTAEEIDSGVQALGSVDI